MFILENASKLLIPHIVDQFVGFVIYHSSALRNSFTVLAACSARDLLLHVVYPALQAYCTLISNYHLASFCSNVFLICLYISFNHPSHPDGGQRALFLRVFYRFFALLEINLSLCQTNGVSYFIAC